MNADEKKGDSYQLFVEGTCFKEVLALTEIDGLRTKFVFNGKLGIGRFLDSTILSWLPKCWALKLHGVQ